MFSWQQWLFKKYSHNIWVCTMSIVCSQYCRLYNVINSNCRSRKWKINNWLRKAWNTLKNIKYNFRTKTVILFYLVLFVRFCCYRADMSRVKDAPNSSKSAKSDGYYTNDNVYRLKNRQRKAITERFRNGNAVNRKNTRYVFFYVLLCHKYNIMHHGIVF